MVDNSRKSQENVSVPRSFGWAQVRGAPAAQGVKSIESQRMAILDRFKLFQGGTGGVDSWLGPSTPDQVVQVLASIEQQPLSRSRLNQLLILSHETSISEAFFAYYWLTAPDDHPYDVRAIPCYSDRWTQAREISSLDQLYWGLYRFYVDALLHFGNIRSAFRSLASLPEPELSGFFVQSRVANSGLSNRGDPIRPKNISRDDRYLISEMACKTFQNPDHPEGELAEILIELYRAHRDAGGGAITARELLTGAYEQGQNQDTQLRLVFSADDLLDDPIENENGACAKNRYCRRQVRKGS